MSFDPQAELDGEPDFRLMMNSCVTLYWRRTLLDREVGRLHERGYQIVRLDASGWTTDGDLHTAIAAALDFPASYGRNLDAFNDCLRDVVDHKYGWRPDATGLVVVFDGYDTFARCRPRSAHVCCWTSSRTDRAPPCCSADACSAWYTATTRTSDSIR